MNDEARKMFNEIMASKRERIDAKMRRIAEVKNAKKRRLAEAEELLRVQMLRRGARPADECDPEKDSTPDPPKSFTAVALTSGQVQQIGDRIEGSTLVRDFCVGCGEAIRVVSVSRHNICLSCRPNGHPGHVDEAVAHDIEYHGGRFHSGEW